MSTTQFYEAYDCDYEPEDSYIISHYLLKLPTELFVISEAKEVMFSVALVCLFACLFVSNISQKVVDGLHKNFIEGS